MNKEVVEDSTVSAEFCFNPTPLVAGQTISKNYAYDHIASYAEQWALQGTGMENFHLYFEYFVDKDLDNLLPEDILTSNTFTLQYEVPFYSN